MKRVLEFITSGYKSGYADSLSSYSWLYINAEEINFLFQFTKYSFDFSHFQNMTASRIRIFVRISFKGLNSCIFIG